jgi:hypothetical protein
MLCLSSNSWCDLMKIDVVFEFTDSQRIHHDRNTRNYVQILSTFRHSYKVYYHKYSLNNTINNYIQTQHEIELKHNKNLNSNISNICCVCIKFILCLKSNSCCLSSNICRVCIKFILYFQIHVVFGFHFMFCLSCLHSNSCCLSSKSYCMIMQIYVLFEFKDFSHICKYTLTLIPRESITTGTRVTTSRYWARSVILTRCTITNIHW